MSYDQPDVYHSPEKFGLKEVCMIDYSGGSYAFDYRVIWRHKESGKLYTARDSGCSCPSPFEDYTKLSDLEEYTQSVIREEALMEAKSEFYRGDDVHSFIEKLP